MDKQPQTPGKPSYEPPSPTLIEWLRTPCPPEDAEPLQWDLSILYLPIEKVMEKIRYMEDTFKATVNMYDVHTWAINTVIPAKDTLWNGQVRVEISSPNFFRSFVGAYTFSTGQYTKNFHYSNTAKSLAIVNAFSSKWEQFGYGLNDGDKDPIKGMKKHIAESRKVNDSLKAYTK